MAQDMGQGRVQTQEHRDVITRKKNTTIQVHRNFMRIFVLY